MDAYALFDALTDVRDGFLEETERRLHGEKRRRVGVYLLAAVLIVLLCFSSAVALDADFRQRVLSLFQVAEVVAIQLVKAYDSDAAGLLSAMAEYPAEDVELLAWLLVYGDLDAFQQDIRQRLAQDDPVLAAVEQAIDRYNGN